MSVSRIALVQQSSIPRVVPLACLPPDDAAGFVKRSHEGQYAFSIVGHAGLVRVICDMSDIALREPTIFLMSMGWIAVQPAGKADASTVSALNTAMSSISIRTAEVSLDNLACFKAARNCSERLRSSSVTLCVCACR